MEEEICAEEFIRGSFDASKIGTEEQPKLLNSCKSYAFITYECVVIESLLKGWFKSASK